MWEGMMTRNNRASIEQETATTGHSRRLRAVLKAARERQRLTAAQVCERIGRIAAEQARAGGAEVEEKAPNINTLYMWEAFNRHPNVAYMAAWARALGYRLIVDLADAEASQTHVILEHLETVEIARLADAMPEARRHALLEWLRSSES